MSQENVEALRRGAEAFNRRDIEAMLKEVDDEVVWHAVLPVTLGGEATVSRGHEGVREMFRDLFDALDARPTSSTWRSEILAAECSQPAAS